MKRQSKKRLLALFLALTMVFTLVPGAYAQGGEEESGLTWEQVDNSEVSASLGREEAAEPVEAPLYDEDEQVRVSIVLEDEPALAKYSLAAENGDMASAAAYEQELREYQNAAAAYISEEVLGNQPLDVVWNLTLAANIISANVEYGQVEEIKAVEGVADVVLEQRYDVQGFQVDADPNMVISTGMTNTSNVWRNGAGYTGAGMRIAIVDTGLDIQHQSFDNDAFLYALNETASKNGKTVSSYDLLDTAEISSVLGTLNAASRLAGVTADDLYYNEKLPYCFNYVDNGLDVTHMNDTQGDHGSHVAGISAANRYLNKDGKFVSAMDEVSMAGDAPDAQVLVMKVFGKGGGAYDSDYMAAIEDAIRLGCDTVNLSLGSGNAGMTTNATYQALLDSLSSSNTMTVMSAGNNSFWAENAAPVGRPYSDDVNFHTGGSPGTYTNTFCVASVDNNGMVGAGAIVVDGVPYSFTESSGHGNAPIATMDPNGNGTEYDYIFVDGFGKPEDFEGIPVSGKVAFCSRGETSFFEKANAAVGAGAIATIVCNNQPGTISMDLTGYTGTAPAVSILQVDAAAIKAASTPVTENGKTYYTGKITVRGSATVFPGTNSYETMSDFSSWGAPGDLSMKPEITAPGGNIWSLLGTSNSHDQYQSMSGTSMASPQIAGIGALVKQHIEQDIGKVNGVTDRALAQSLIMSTATPLKDANGEYYSILNQGAGMVNTEAAVNADSFILMDSSANDSWKDGKVKAELGDDPSKTGVYTVNFKIFNLDGVNHAYLLDADVFTQGMLEDEYGDTYLDTATTPLNATVDWTWNGAVSGGGKFYDFNGDGYVNLEDGNALLDVATGARTLASLSNQDLVKDFMNEDGEITSFSGHEFLRRAADVAGGEGTLVVPAMGSVNVTATIRLFDSEIAQWDDNGFYVEAYLKATSIADAEGALGTSHTIPVLAYFGNWTDSSMFDKGSRIEYQYGLEDRSPYYYTDINPNYGLALKTNTLIMQYAGDSGSYYFGGNPYVLDEEYIEARNALNNQDGNKLTGVQFAPIRNAAASRLTITDVNTGEVYQTIKVNPYYAGYYVPRTSQWQGTSSTLNMNWMGTDAEGNKLPEGTTVEVAFTAAPEYYGDTYDEINWNALGKGATIKTQLTIDNTAPVILDGANAPAYDATTGKLTIKAQDNEYVAAAMLINSSGTAILARETPNQTVKGEQASVELDLDGVVGKTFYIQVMDYADNTVTYKFEQGIRPTTEEYYTFFNNHEGFSDPQDIDYRWVTYSKNGSESTFLSEKLTSSDVRLKAGAYAGGYIFGFDGNWNFYAIDALDVADASLVASLNGVVQNCYDMAYNKADGQMYLLYTGKDTIGTAMNLGTIDLATGEVTNLGAVNPSAQGLAITDDGVIYVMNTSPSAGEPYSIYSLPTPTGAETELVFTKVVDTDLRTNVAGSFYQTSPLTWDSNANELVLGLCGLATDGATWISGIYVIDLKTGETELRVELPANTYVTALFTPDKGGVTLPSTSEATDIILDAEELTLVKGDRKTLAAIVLPWNLDNKDVTWSSSDESVATVSNSGVVTAVKGGTTTITVSSDATPSVTAECEVTVVSIDADLEGLVWDENGKIHWSAFNTDSLPDYDIIKDCDVNGLASATVTADGEIYGATMDDQNGVSNIYKIDPVTLEGTLLNNNYVDGGGNQLFVADMAYAPNVLGGSLLALYGPYVCIVNKDTGACEGLWSWGVNNGINLVAIAYAGSVLNTYYNAYIDKYFMIDANGNVYEEYFASITEDGVLNNYYWNGAENALIGSTGYDTDGLLFFNSATMAADNNGNEYLFWSQYDEGDYVNILATDLYGSGKTYELGSFGSGVWPVGGLMSDTLEVQANSLTIDAETEPAQYVATEDVAGAVDFFATAESKFTEEMDMDDAPEAEEPEFEEDVNTIPEDEVSGEEEAPAPEETPEEPPVDEELPEEPPVDEELPEEPPVEDLETVSMSVNSDSGTATVRGSGRVVVDIKLDQASTNGMVQLSYDANALRLISVSGKAVLNSANTSKDGEITLAYAYRSQVAADTAVASLVFSSRNGEDSVITLTQLEDGKTNPGTVTNVPVILPDDSTGPSYPGGNNGSSGGSSNHPSNPSKPTNPTNPSKPTDPTEPAEPSEPSKPTTPGGASNQFADLTSGSWYDEYVDYVVSNGLMTGTNDNTFSPNASLTRGMLVTILHRAANQPNASGSVSFKDVESGSWYAAGVQWAAANGLVTGYDDNSFRPNGNISRQELAVILWRYAQQLGISVATDGTTMPDFADRGEMAPWAAEAMAWAYRMGIISGRDENHLAPNGGATRIETAAMLVRFLKLAEKNQSQSLSM